MDPGEKPFPCKIDGCKLSFVTEDHLNVHRKKHDMMLLNLELPNKSNLFADQTPTPTRLIGKCEEVGLFEDLQNVNPFEETFRRAVEEKQSGGLVVDLGDGSGTKKSTGVGVPAAGTGGADDTLHTPHVFPLLERRDSHKLSKLIISRSSSKKDSAEPDTTAAKEASTAIKRKRPQDKAVQYRKPPVTILPKIEPKPVMILRPAEDERLTTTTKASNELDPVKAKLKEHLVKNGAKPVEAKPLPKAAIASVIVTKVPRAIRPADDKQQRTVVNEMVEDTDQKHERWKAAAKRYRTRVKQNQDTLHQQNLNLQEENFRLKTELLRLRKMLLLHKDCPVTRAMEGKARTTTTAAAGPSSVAVQPPVVRADVPATATAAVRASCSNHRRVPDGPSQQLVVTQHVVQSASIEHPIYVILSDPVATSGTVSNLQTGGVEKISDPAATSVSKQIVLVSNLQTRVAEKSYGMPSKAVGKPSIDRILTVEEF